MPRQNILIALCVTLASLFCVGRVSLSERIFQYVLTKIERQALYPTDRGQLIQGALSGMTEKVDDAPYTAYLAPEEEADYEEEIQGRLAGIGIGRMQIDDDALWFTPLLRSPAGEKLRFGDRIVEANGKEFRGLDIDKISDLLRGPEGTTVTLSVLPRETVGREPTPEDRQTVEITRRTFQQDIVAGDRRSNDGSWIFTLETRPDIGYIRIEQFTDATADEFCAALKKLDGEKMTGLILDLRRNPGGFLPAAVAVCEPFLPRGTLVVTTRERNGTVKNKLVAGDSQKRDWPLAVLIDSESASASEIVASALADHHRATLVGTRSYGKGTVQELFPLPCQMGMLRLTDASFWRPSGEPIHRRSGMSDQETWGVQPDEGFDVPLSPNAQYASILYRDLRSFPDFQKNFAEMETIIRLRLDRLAEEIAEEKLSKDSDTQAAENISANNDSDKKIVSGSAPYYDAALDRAVEALGEEKTNAE